MVNSKLSQQNTTTGLNTFQTIIIHSQLKLTDNDIDQSASFPFHALDATLGKLVKAGYRVSVREPLEDLKSDKEKEGKRNFKRS